jgi:osmoprotectant transport system ATP-binding protein
MILLDKVSKSFDNGATYAVEDLTLEVSDGETLVLLGHSGCGKTTTLKMINRLIERSSGEIVLDNRNVTDFTAYELRRSIGYVFQGIGLFPHMSVQQNVEIVPRLLNWPVSDRRERAESLLSMVGLTPSEFSHRYPNELSGGQQQRVGVARALAADPKYLLMDEPFGALDSVTRDTLQRELLDIKERLSKTIVFVTHDIVEAFRIGDRVAILHEGRLEQVGDKEQLFHSPASPRVEELIQKTAKQLASFVKDM